MKILNIEDKDENQRFDKFLMKYFNNASKGFIYKMLRKKRIKYNGRKANGNEIIKSGDIVQIYISEDTIYKFIEKKEIKKTDIEFSIIYEDNNLIIVNKPSGLIVHPDKENISNTLNDQILYYLYKKGEISQTFTPSICNRLDRNTSGIVLFGKNLASVQALNNAIKENKIEKYYIAIVYGNINKDGILRGYYIKKDNNIVKIYNNKVEGSKEVITEYKVLKNKDNYTMLEIKLITGKSHQIRASLYNMGYPIIGDRKYGNEKINKLFKDKYCLNNQFLHAYKIIFNDKESILSYLNNKEFTAPLESAKINIINSILY